MFLSHRSSGEHSGRAQEPGNQTAEAARRIREADCSSKKEDMIKLI
jgi:hypothetical protein